MIYIHQLLVSSEKGQTYNVVQGKLIDETCPIFQIEEHALVVVSSTGVLRHQLFPAHLQHRHGPFKMNKILNTESTYSLRMKIYECNKKELKMDYSVKSLKMTILVL